MPKLNPFLPIGFLIIGNLFIKALRVTICPISQFGWIIKQEFNTKASPITN